MRAFHHKKFTPLTGLAIASLLVLIGVIAWQATAFMRPAPLLGTQNTGPETTVRDPLWEQEMMLLGLATSSGPIAENGTDPIALITPQIVAQLLGKYTALIDSGTFTPEAGAEAAAAIAPNVRALVPYTPFQSVDLKTTDDTSYASMLTYRTELQTALKPLLSNARAEYEIYGSYIESGDAKELEELLRVAKNYSDAADNMMRLTVPSDAKDLHVKIANALGHFSATLKAMAIHADDPLASAALLRTYNDTELAVVTSFDTFAKYGKSKTP